MSLPGRLTANTWWQWQIRLNAMVVYSRETKTWRTLKQFGADWGFWRWSADSKSILMAKNIRRARRATGSLPIEYCRWQMDSGCPV